ncbi:hypothetical protein ACWIWK_03125 [Helicobacter sp. 23-1048]
MTAIDENTIKNHIIDTILECGVLNDSNYKENLSRCLELMRDHIDSLEREFSRDSSFCPIDTTILIDQYTIRYTKILNQESIFRKFLYENINFCTNDRLSKERSIDSYISMLNSLSREVTLYCGVEFHFLCFMGNNADIDFIFQFIIELNIFSEEFIADSNSVIEHYKNFNMQVLQRGAIPRAHGTDGSVNYLSSEGDIYGGWGYTQQEAVVLGKSIQDIIEVEDWFLAVRILEEGIPGAEFKRVKEEFYHNKGRHYHKITIFIRFLPPWTRIDDMRSREEIQKLVDSGNIKTINFEAVCWFDITNHFSEDMLLFATNPQDFKSKEDCYLPQCRGCEKYKTSDKFYLIDGGLKIEGIENLRFGICKECMKIYNEKNHKKQTDNYKYLDWQCISCYFVAKLEKTAKRIDNGMLNTNSKRDTIKNMRYLLGKNDSFEHKSEQHKKIFDILQNANTQTDLQKAIQEILAEDYKTFEQFKQMKAQEKEMENVAEFVRILFHWYFTGKRGFRETILVQFLELSSLNTRPVKRYELEEACKETKEDFISNYDDMCNMSRSSRFDSFERPFSLLIRQAKVFEEVNEEVMLWQPVADIVLEAYNKAKSLADEPFTSVGGQFLLTNVEEIIALHNKNYTTAQIAEIMFKKGYDSNISDTQMRISSILCLIRENRIIEAIEKVRDSARINNEHPQARSLAIEILQRISKNPKY